MSKSKKNAEPEVVIPGEEVKSEPEVNSEEVVEPEIGMIFPNTSISGIPKPFGEILVAEPYSLEDFSRDFERLKTVLAEVSLLKAQARDKKEDAVKRYRDALDAFNKSVSELKKIDN